MGRYPHTLVTGISGKEFADKLANSSTYFSRPSSTKIPWSDFIPILIGLAHLIFSSNTGVHSLLALPPGTEIYLQPSQNYLDLQLQSF